MKKRIDGLDLKEGEKPKPPKEEILEVEDDWEPFVKISIFNQNLLAYCDIGSMVSTMPKTDYDTLKLVSMVDLPCFHDHSNGNVYDIKGEVKNIQYNLVKEMQWWTSSLWSQPIKET